MFSEVPLKVGNETLLQLRKALQVGLHLGEFGLL